MNAYIRSLEDEVREEIRRDKLIAFKSRMRFFLTQIEESPENEEIKTKYHKFIEDKKESIIKLIKE